MDATRDDGLDQAKAVKFAILEDPRFKENPDVMGVSLTREGGAPAIQINLAQTNPGLESVTEFSGVPIVYKVVGPVVTRAEEGIADHLLLAYLEGEIEDEQEIKRIEAAVLADEATAALLDEIEKSLEPDPEVAREFRRQLELLNDSIWGRIEFSDLSQSRSKEATLNLPNGTCRQVSIEANDNEVSLRMDAPISGWRVASMNLFHPQGSLGDKSSLDSSDFRAFAGENSEVLIFHPECPTPGTWSSNVAARFYTDRQREAWKDTTAECWVRFETEYTPPQFWENS